MENEMNQDKGRAAGSEEMADMEEELRKLREENRLLKGEIRELSGLTSGSGRLMSGRREKSRERRAEEITRTLFRISNAVNTTKDLGELYASIHRILGEVIDLTNFFIAIYDQKAGRVSFPYFVDQYDSGVVYSDQINEKNSLTGEVLVTRDTVFLDKDALQQRAAKNCVIGTVPLAWMGVPLQIKGEVIGVMAAQSYDVQNRFDLFDLDILNSVSDQVALAIERKRNEQALILSERKYRNIIETIEDGYFEMDLDGRLTLVNQAICNMLGYDDEELLGQDTSLYLDEQSEETIRNLFHSVRLSGQSGNLLQLELKTKDGETLFGETVVSAIFNEQGAVSGFRGIARDITQRIEEEKARKILQEQLQQSQRLESLGTLAGGIAHDFNNLLMGVQGRVELMLNGMPDDYEHYDHLVNIKDYLKNAAGLTKRLLGFARGGKYEVRPLNLNSVVGKSIQMFNPARKEITISTTYDDELWSVEADFNQIEQVLLNLLVNSAQAMTGSGNIFIETRNKSIGTNDATPMGITPGNYVQLTIKDDGIGIGKEVIGKIFDPFFTTKETGYGTGLGLAMVYGIIRNHHGSIAVESEINKGAKFIILLPASAKEIEDEKKDAAVVRKGSEVILLVDDESMIIEVGREILKAIGYEVITASSGENALDLYTRNQERVDLVILDMILPEMSGGEIFDRLKEINPDVKVLLASGYSLEGEARQILERGCRGFIQKPFTISELSVKLRKILGN